MAARSKLDILYQDILGDIQTLVDRVEAIPAAAGQAESEIRGATGELREELEKLSRNWSASHRFSSVQVIAAAIGGAVIVIALLAAATFAAASKSLWIANAEHHKVVGAVDQTGIDVTALSTADLRARLSYSAEDGRLLVDILGTGDRERESERRKAVDVILAWLKQLPVDRRRPLLEQLMRAVTIADTSPAKAAVIAAVTGMSDEDAWALASSTSDVRLLIHQLAGLSPQTRARLIAGDFFCAGDRAVKR